MHELTLFVDESGDFTSDRGEWLVAGALCRGTPESARESLRSALGEATRIQGLDPSIPLHLTELRKGGHEFAEAVADTVLEYVVAALPEIRFYAAVNKEKKATSERERTYRLMLVDLLALVESNFDVLPDRLNVVVATRTFEQGPGNWVSMTTLSELRVTVDRLQAALENGLASSGMADLIVRRRLVANLQQARHCPGLTIADIVANTVYNQKYQADQQRITRHQIVLFESFGDYVRRRARIAERDKDFVGALYWLSGTSIGAEKAIIEAKKSQEEERIVESIRELLVRVEKRVGQESLRATLDGFIERLWQQAGLQSSGFSTICRLERVENALERISTFQGHPHNVPQKQNESVSLLIRLRTFALNTANHQGNVNQGQPWAERLEQNVSRSLLGPENLPLLFAAERALIAFHENQLDVVEMRRRTERYLEMVGNFGVLWSLWDSENDVDTFVDSRLYLVAVSQDLRAQILTTLPILLSPRTKEQWNGLVEALKTHLQSSFSEQADRSRLESYLTHALLRQERHDDALSFLENVTLEASPSSGWGLFWAARTAGDVQLRDMKSDHFVERIQSSVVATLKGLTQQTALSCLMQRELAVMQYKQGSTTRAKQTLSQVEKAQQKLYRLHPSPMNYWLWQLTELHQLIFNAESQSQPYQQWQERLHQTVSVFVRPLLAEKYDSSNPLSILLKARSLSPY